MKNILKVALVAGALACSVPLHAAKPEAVTVAVYDFTDADHSVSGFGKKVAALVTADLTTHTNLVMLERADLTKVLDEMKFDISGVVNSDAAMKIGQVTGVKVLVSGQVMTTGNNRLILIANIIGTETSRLFAARVEGAPDQLTDLTAKLSHKIADTISAQVTNLVSAPLETREQRIARIVNSITGTNRPTVSVKITAYNGQGHTWDNFEATGELSAILLKAGFTVVDEGSDTKPDVEITGIAGGNSGMPRGDLITGRVVMDMKVQERRTGKIICFDRQESTATDLGASVAGSVATIKAVDELAARIVPLLAK